VLGNFEAIEINIGRTNHNSARVQIIRKNKLFGKVRHDFKETVEGCVNDQLRLTFGETVRIIETTSVSATLHFSYLGY